MHYFVFLILFLMPGCIVSSKVIELERVDQAIEGNAGYILGHAPEKERVASKRKKKRRILEVDMTRLFEEA